MTPEQRFDRIERIVKLMVKAGLRARSQMRDQGEKINIIIGLQLQNEERFTRLADAQSHSNRRLDALIDVVRRDRNGKTSGGQ